MSVRDWLSSRTILPSLWMCVDCEGLADPTFSVDVCEWEGLAEQQEDITFSVDVCDWEAPGWATDSTLGLQTK